MRVITIATDFGAFLAALGNALPSSFLIAAPSRQLSDRNRLSIEEWRNRRARGVHCADFRNAQQLRSYIRIDLGRVQSRRFMFETNRLRQLQRNSARSSSNVVPFLKPKRPA